MNADDVWLNNSAVYVYGGIDDREALRWSLDGIDLAIATGDYDQVIGQLVECAERSWAALGEPVDQAVLDRAEAFQRSWTRPPWKNRFPDLEPQPEHPCSHCGWDPAILRGRSGYGGAAIAAETASTPRSPAERVVNGSVAVAVAWFPAGEWVEAVRRWPDLLYQPSAPHPAYSHEIEARTKRLSRQLPGRALHISPRPSTDSSTTLTHSVAKIQGRRKPARRTLRSSFVWEVPSVGRRAATRSAGVGRGRSTSSAVGRFRRRPTTDGDRRPPAGVTNILRRGVYISITLRYYLLLRY